MNNNVPRSLLTPVARWVRDGINSIKLIASIICQVVLMVVAVPVAMVAAVVAFVLYHFRFVVVAGGFFWMLTRSEHPITFTILSIMGVFVYKVLVSGSDD